MERSIQLNKEPLGLPFNPRSIRALHHTLSFTLNLSPNILDGNILVFDLQVYVVGLGGGFTEAFSDGGNVSADVF